MKVLTTITPKFQVHIPVSIRRKVDLAKHGKAIIYAEKKKIIIKPVESSFLSLGGKFHVSKPISSEHIRDHIDYTDAKR